MTTTEDKLAKPKNTPLSVFLARSGYTAEDVLIHNPLTRVFVTSNGGKYQLAKNGSIRKLKGPDFPKFVAEE